jgi:hypothetical protein
MSFVITQTFSIVGRPICLKCPARSARVLVRGPIIITKQIGPATYEATGRGRHGQPLIITVKRDEFILPPTTIEQEPIWGEDDFNGFVYPAGSGFYNPFRKF